MKKSLSLFLLCFSTAGIFAQTAATYSQKDVNYDRLDGTSLMMTVLTPKTANGKGIISLLSGNFASDYRLFDLYRDRALVLVNHGYTVFLVMHHSAPRFAIPDMLADVQRSIQFVRHHASDYKIDPGHLGITGTSSGGYLALLTALSKDIAEPTSRDSISRITTRVQAVAVFCPPTDLLNFGKAGYNLAEDQATLIQIGVLGAFKYTRWDKSTRTYESVTDPQQRRSIDTLLSPVQLAGSNSPPVYVMHGDKDPLVPLQQSQSLVSKLQAAGVPAKLAVKPGAGHGWKGINQDEEAFNEWFDQYLKK